MMTYEKCRNSGALNADDQLPNEDSGIPVASDQTTVPEKALDGKIKTDGRDAPVGWSAWIENGQWYKAPTVDREHFGNHDYGKGGIGECKCGCHMSGYSSCGPVDPFGACPLNPRKVPSQEPTAPIAEDASGSTQIPEFERDERSSTRGEEKPVEDWTIWERFPGWLIDHCEGEVITEEFLQGQLAKMIADDKKKGRLTASTPDAPERNTGPRIYTRCPACGNDTLTINEGHLLCTWHTCPNPTLIDSGAPSDPARVSSDATSVSSPKSSCVAAAAGQEEGEPLGLVDQVAIEVAYCRHIEFTVHETARRVIKLVDASLREKEEALAESEKRYARLLAKQIVEQDVFARRVAEEWFAVSRTYKEQSKAVEALADLICLTAKPDPTERKQAEVPQMAVYVASKVKHAGMWRDMRARGLPIAASWIDEAGEGQTSDHSELAQRCITEIASADFLILYCEPGEIQKGATIEAGIALGLGKEVRCVGTCETISKTFKRHPLWSEHPSVEDAIEKCLSENVSESDGASGASSSKVLSTPESSSAGGENPSGK